MIQVKYGMLSSTPQCIIADGVHHTTSQSIASVLNSYFALIGKFVAEKITLVASVSVPATSHSFQRKKISKRKFVNNC